MADEANRTVCKSLSLYICLYNQLLFFISIVWDCDCLIRSLIFLMLNFWTGFYGDSRSHDWNYWKIKAGDSFYNLLYSYVMYKKCISLSWEITHTLMTLTLCVNFLFSGVVWVLPKRVGWLWMELKEIRGLRFWCLGERLYCWWALVIL